MTVQRKEEKRDGNNKEEIHIFNIFYHYFSQTDFTKWFHSFRFYKHLTNIQQTFHKHHVTGILQGTCHEHVRHEPTCPYLKETLFIRQNTHNKSKLKYHLCEHSHIYGFICMPK